MRKSGIDIIGDVPWGTHFALFYRTKEDLIDVLVPYFVAGLENNEYCMWVTAEPLDAGEARAKLAAAMPDFGRYVEKGQIEIIPFTDWYKIDGKFDGRAGAQRLDRPAAACPGAGVRRPAADGERILAGRGASGRTSSTTSRRSTRSSASTT